MRIGILQCDDVADPLRERHGNYPDMVQTLLTAVDPRLKFYPFACHRGELPGAKDAMDGWVITGSKYGVNDGEEWIEQTAELLRQFWQTRQAVVGLCFGHQLIAYALGGRVAGDVGWNVGVSFNRIVQRQPWMTPWRGEDLQLLVSHRDQVVELPPEAVVLASNAVCPIFMMQVGSNFLGLQGHPEFTKGYAGDLMQARRGAIPELRIEAGLHSLFLPVDDLVVGRWLLNFLQAATLQRAA